MRKVLTCLIIIASIFTCLSQTYNFNWANPGTLTPAFPAPDPNNRYGEYISNVEFKSGPVSFVVNDDGVLQGSQKARFLYGYTTQTVEMRAYQLSVISISVSEGYKIDEIRFEESQVREIPLDYTGTQGLFKNNVWTAKPTVDLERVDFDVISTTNCTLTSVKVSEKSLDSVSNIISGNDEECEEWYTLSGMRLSARPELSGLYICRKGGNQTKVIVK